MAQVTVVMLRLSIAILLGASLSEVFGTPLKEVHVIIDEEDTENRTREIELDIDLDDMPASITDAILRGDYSKLIELEVSIAEMNESSQTDDTLDSLDDANERWDRTIFPPDDRRPVSSSQLSSYPYCAIGFLKTGCTAAFIGPRHALTAAHCVVGQSTSRLDMCRGQSCSRGGQLMHYAGQSYVPRGYYNWWIRDDYDYALLLYQETSPCYLRFGYRSSWEGYGFKVIGYPGDKRADDLDHCAYHSMFYSECSRSYTLGRYRLKYHCDAIGGNSGSPLMSRDPSNSNAQRIVYGIHTHSSPNYNLGARITQTRFCNFVEWMRERGHTAMCGSQPCCNSNNGGGGDGCFPPHATVVTYDSNGPVYVKDLKIGDTVLATTTAGTVVYSPVIAFLDKSTDKEMSFLKIETENNELLLTSTHLIFHQTSRDGSLANSKAVFASNIKNGDHIFVMSSNSSMISEQVIKVSSVKVKGAYGPLTAEGTVVVNNVATSCYAVIESHTLLHTAFAPLRFLYNWFPGFFLSATEQKGQHWYTHLLAQVGHYIYPYVTTESELSGAFYNYI